MSTLYTSDQLVGLCYFGNNLVKKIEGTVEKVETETKQWLDENVSAFARKYHLDVATISEKDHPYKVFIDDLRHVYVS
jgi:hypothetical protein